MIDAIFKVYKKIELMVCNIANPGARAKHLNLKSCGRFRNQVGAFKILMDQLISELKPDNLAEQMEDTRTRWILAAKMVMNNPDEECAGTTRFPVCCWSPCSGAKIPASCVLAFYWSIVQNGEKMISSKYIFQLIFYWKGIYYGLLHHKT